MNEAVATGELAATFEELHRGGPEAAEIEAYATHLPLPSGLVLDGMAGVGRLLLPLLGRGFHVHGAESVPSRAARLSSRLEAAGQRATLFRQELASLNVPFRYGAAYVAAPGPQELASPKLAAGLARVRAHLVPPGTLLLTFVVPHVAAHQPGAPSVEIERVRLPDGSSITLRAEIDVDAEARRIDRRERYERRDGRAVTAREDAHRRMTWYDEPEAVALVQAAGYRAVRTAILPTLGGGPPGRPFAIIATA